MSHTAVGTALFSGRARVALTTNATPPITWTPFSNALVQMDGPVIERPTNAVYSAGSVDIPIVLYGKRRPVEITLRVLYREGTGDAATVAVDRMLSYTTTTLIVAWRYAVDETNPRDYVTSQDGTTVGFAVIKSVTLSPIEPAEANEAVVEIVLEAPAVIVTQSLVDSAFA